MKNYLKYLNESPTVFFEYKNSLGNSVEFVTENVKEIFGYSSYDFKSKNFSFLDLVFEEDKKQFLEEINHISKNSEDKYEFKPCRMIAKDKKQLWVQIIVRIELDKTNHLTYYHCYITDITNQIKMNKKFDYSEDIISTIYNNSFQFIGLMNPDGTLIRANRTSLDLVGLKEVDIIGKKFWDCPWWKHCKRDQKILKEDIKRASKGEFIHSKKVHYDKDGNKINVDFSIKPVFNHKNEVIYLIPEGHNISHNVLKEKQLDRYMKIINENVLVTTTDLEGYIVACSDKFIQTSGFSKKELIGNRYDIVMDFYTDETLYDELWQTISSGKVWVGEHKNITKNGKVYWVENIITPNFDNEGNIETYTSICKDITLRKEISELLITDVLTSLYNRRHFNTIFNSELTRSKRHSYNFVLMILDIDFFKQYNDTYGHHAGDLALESVACALKDSLKRAEDYVFRLGGEEFCIITTDITNDGVYKLAHELKNSVEDLKIEHKENIDFGNLTISLGVKIVDANSELIYEQIYKEADNALYKAKNDGRNKVFVIE